ncbi:unnamed protein product, partial [Ectocarpus sp. 12 AP-2014]
CWNVPREVFVVGMRLGGGRGGGYPSQRPWSLFTWPSLQ